MHNSEIQPGENHGALPWGARVAFRVAIVLLGFLRVWILRFYIEPDGVNYLDIAREYLKGSAGHAINGFWSPLWPWILMAVEGAAHGRSYWEVPVLHALNFLAFWVSLLCFEDFFRELMAVTRPSDADGNEVNTGTDWAWWTLGYALFAYCSLVMTPASIDSPDVMVTALVFAASALVLLFGQRSGKSLGIAVALGIVLALAFLAKTAMFLVGFVFVACALIAAWPSNASERKIALRNVAIAGAVFVLLSLPWIVALSRAEHRTTFGDSGRIAYWMYTHGVQSTFHYHGEHPEAGVAEHPVEAVETHPAVDSFARHAVGSYPLLFDPSYWYEGIHPHFSVAGQRLVFRQTVPMYFLMAISQAVLFAGWLVLVAFCGWRGYVGRVIGLAYVWLPSAEGIALYFMVHAEARFVGAFVVVCWASLFLAARMAESIHLHRVVTGVLVVTSLVIAVPVVHISARDYFGNAIPRWHVQWGVCQALESMGIAPGERVAVIGDPTVANYWAHCGEWSVVADVQPDAAREFWSADAATRARIYSELRGLGAKALVVAPGLGGGMAEGWKPIGATGYGVYILDSGADESGGADGVGKMPASAKSLKFTN